MRPIRGVLLRSNSWPLAALLSFSFGCAHDPRVFPLRAPVLRDQDLDDVALPCAGAPKCMPAVRESSFAWDAADNTLFRPAHDALVVKRTGEAVDVNALDEVPESSWFTNRIGARAMSPEEVFLGSCPSGKTLEPEAAGARWRIDHGKDNGFNPGFRIKADGVKYMLKTDYEQGERATAATAIATRLYHAAGYYVPCDSIVYFRRSVLELEPGLVIKANVGPPKKFDEALLDSILKQASRRGDTIRAAASRWLPGEPLGPFTYGGTKDDDPNDIVAHEMRREVRGSRLIAAWMNHFDSREQNSMMVWMPAKDGISGHGSVRHWIIDIGDPFGSEWAVDGISKRLGQSYLLDFRWLGEDFVELGIPQRPWETVQRTKDFGYFDAEHFDPEEWKGLYPNPAFQAMTERDGAWAARIIARFERAHVEAAVRAGDLTDPHQAEFLVDTLMQRRAKILRRYFKTVSPLTDVKVQGDELCAVDLARKTGTYAHFVYTADVRRAGGAAARTWTHQRDDGSVCAHLDRDAPGAGVADGDPARYLVVDLRNGASEQPLRVHLYDLGPVRGLRVAGIERPY